MGIWDKYELTFDGQNDLHKEEAIEVMSKVKVVVALDIYQYPQAQSKSKMDNFDEADIQKSCAWTQVKDYEILTIASRSLQIGRKLQARTKTTSPPVLNIESA